MSDAMLNNILLEPFIVRRVYTVAITVDNPVAIASDLQGFINNYIVDNYVNRCFVGSMIIGIHQIVRNSGLMMNSISITPSANINVEFIANCLVVAHSSVLVGTRILSQLSPKIVHGESLSLPWVRVTVSKTSATAFIAKDAIIPCTVLNVGYGPMQPTMQLRGTVYKHEPKYFNVVAPREGDVLTADETRDLAYKRDYMARLLQYAQERKSAVWDMIPLIFREDVTKTGVDVQEEIPLTIGHVRLRYGAILMGPAIIAGDAPEGVHVTTVHSGPRGQYMILAEYIRALHIITQFAETAERYPEFKTNRGLWAYYAKN